MRLLVLILLSGCSNISINNKINSNGIICTQNINALCENFESVTRKYDNLIGTYNELIPIDIGELPSHAFIYNRIDESFSKNELKYINRLAFFNYKSDSETLKEISNLAYNGGLYDAPGRIASFADLLFWQDTRGIFDPAGNGPLGTWKSRSGVCVEQSSFISHMLELGGTRSQVVTYFSPNNAHAVSLYKSKLTNKWNVIDYNNHHLTESDSISDAMMKVAPDAFQLLIHGRQSDYNKVSAPEFIVETDTSIELKKYILGTNSIKPGSMQYAWSNRRSNGISIPIKDNASLDLAVRPNDENRTLNGLYGTTLRYTISDNNSLHIGAVSLPMAFYRDVSLRILNSNPIKIFYIGNNTSIDIVNHELFTDFNYISAIRLENIAALSTFGYGQIDIGVSSALTDSTMFLVNILSYNFYNLNGWIESINMWSTKLVGTYILHDAPVKNIPLNNIIQAGLSVSLDSFTSSVVINNTLDYSTNIVMPNRYMMFNISYNPSNTFLIIAQLSKSSDNNIIAQLIISN